MPLKVADLVDRARARIKNLDVETAKAMHANPDVVFVDLRDGNEIAAEGTIPGAVHMPRGNLEFWLDPDSSYFKPVFASGRQFVFFCAADLRSTLATAAAQDFGLSNVAHITGGFRAWRDAGGAVTDTPAPLSDL
jgi:Rhodanese-related sulfurtransferase